jgi:hypothetical protein
MAQGLLTRRGSERGRMPKQTFGGSRTSGAREEIPRRKRQFMGGAGTELDFWPRLEAVVELGMAFLVLHPRLARLSAAAADPAASGEVRGLHSSRWRAVEQLILRHPMARMTREDEIASAVLWLCSESQLRDRGAAVRRRRLPRSVRRAKRANRLALESRCAPGASPRTSLRSRRPRESPCRHPRTCP